MKRKAIKDLARLPAQKFFAEVESGIKLCLANARQIEKDAAQLAKNSGERGAKILRLSAEEEAAKVLILLDAVRCPRKPPEFFSRQLGYFKDHLAKGIYARYCGARPTKFLDIRKWIEDDLHEFYLDGPNDVDWIFRNKIISRREDTIYVDYFESDGKYQWHNPTFGEGWSPGLYAPSLVFRLTDAMSNAGCFTVAALAEIATIWREIEMHDEFSWMDLEELNRKTLETINAKGVLANRPGEEYAIIVREWMFPLWTLDLHEKKVDQNDLREVQKNWVPD